jgi:hypothetical protein
MYHNEYIRCITKWHKYTESTLQRTFKVLNCKINSISLDSIETFYERLFGILGTQVFILQFMMIVQQGNGTLRLQTSGFVSFTNKLSTHHSLRIYSLQKFNEVWNWILSVRNYDRRSWYKTHLRRYSVLRQFWLSTQSFFLLCYRTNSYLFNIYFIFISVEVVNIVIYRKNYHICIQLNSIKILHLFIYRWSWRLT